MKKIILTLFATLSITSGFAQKTVKTIDGQTLVNPVYSEDMPLLSFKRFNDFEDQSIPDNRVSRAIAKKDYIKHTGNIKIPVILVNFSDTTLHVTNPKQAFTTLFNRRYGESIPEEITGENGNGIEQNYAGVTQYFYDMSHGAFTPTFDVYGPVNIDSKQYSTSGSTIATEAITALSNSSELDNVDLSQYDNDGDGMIDGVYIIFPGCSSNFGYYQIDDNAVWAQTARTAASLRGTQVRWYCCSGELVPTDWAADSKHMMTGVGVLCHELTHTMGIADIYPTTDAAKGLDNQEMEYWDLMDGGEYVGNGFCPTPYTAWEKYQMEWDVDIQKLSSDQTVTMTTSTENQGTVYKMENPNDQMEYILLENIIRKGWGSKQLAEGLIAYHVQDEKENISLLDNYNNVPGKPRMAIIPADGICISSYNENYTSAEYRNSQKHDLFGTEYFELNDAQKLPNFYWYTDAGFGPSETNSEFFKINQALLNIKKNGNVVSFDYIANYEDYLSGIDNINLSTNKVQRIYSLDGRYVGNNASTLPKGIYIKGNKKFVVK